MYETVWFGLLLVAGTFSSIQLMFKRGGIFGTLAIILFWAVIYFASLNVTVSTSAGVIRTQNPLMQWVALGMVALHVLVLLMVLFGVGQFAETDASEDDMMDMASDIRRQVR